jgi:NAD(P)-dependent dehydrogenase (short-subunit alcohol dehydrogenase family)
VFLGIKHAIRAMRPGGSAGRGGVIVNLSSVAGLIGLTALGAYCSSKGAVRLMTKAAAAECARLGYGIRVNSIHPSIVKTEMGANVVKGFARTGLTPDEATADAYVESLHPLGYGKPEDVASAVLYLASPALRWMTGSEFVVDGGATVS